jgi:hypothetical protein
VRRSVTRAIPRNPVRPLAAALAGCDWAKRPCIRPLKSTQGVSRSGRAQLARSPGPGSGCTLTASSTDRSELRERVSEERELWAGNRLLDKRRAPPRPVQDSSDLPLPITASGLFTPLATWKRPKGFLPHAFPRRTNYRAASFPFPTSNAYDGAGPV